jgi:hypothetical protein
MARQYAQIFTEIWRNADFTALDRDEQWMYLLLNTQPDISAAGVLTTAAARWAKRAPGTTPAMIFDLLDRLTAKRFLVLDHGTNEILLRTFIKHDHGYTNSRRLPAIRDAINMVESETLLRSIANELKRLSVPSQYWGAAGAFSQVDSLSDGHSSGPSETPSGRVPEDPKKTSTEVDASCPAKKTGKSTSAQVDSLLDRPGDSHGRFRRRVPQPTTHNPQTQKPKTLFPLAAQDGANGNPRRRRSTAERNADDPLFAEFYAAYPRKKEPVAARKAWDKAIRNADPQAIIKAAHRLAAEGRTPQFTPYPASWLNAGGWADEPDPQVLQPRGGFDARAAEFDQMRDRLRATNGSDGALALLRATTRELTTGESDA